MKKPRKLGINQLSVLQFLRDKGDFTPNGLRKWSWGGPRATAKICESLVDLGLVAGTYQNYSHYKTYTITEKGRKAYWAWENDIPPEEVEKRAPPTFSGIRVYWKLASSDKIESGIAASVTDKKVILADGGWNPIENCFLTVDQCRKFHGLADNADLSKARDRLDRAHNLLKVATQATKRAIRSLEETQ